MYFYSFENDKLKRELRYGNPINLFIRTLKIPENGLVLYDHVVTIEQEGRMGEISDYLYGSRNYVEELMFVNNIKFSFNVKYNDIIKYPLLSDIALLYFDDTVVAPEIIDNSKNTKRDSNRLSDLVPSAKLNDVDPVKWDKTSKKITINNKFN